MSGLGAAAVLARLVVPVALAQDTAGARAPADARGAPLAVATFAGGCFWCVEEAFDKIAGVVETTSGYIGGQVAHPTYQQVSAGGTGHAEAVQVRYDSTKVTYDQLLWVFWRNIDPTVRDRQFCDAGRQYRSAIFYHNETQRAKAEASKRELEASGRFKGPIATETVPAGPFYPAEEYHQDYYRKNPVRYRFYKWNCGRSQRLEELWRKEAHPEGPAPAPQGSRE